MSETVVDETLLGLFNMWYGTRYKSNRNLDCLSVSLPHEVIERQWRDLWFNKTNQKEIDELLTYYKPFIYQFQTSNPNHFIEQMALIILFDQVTRNIFRGSAEAYAFDHLSRAIALGLLERIPQMGAQYKLTVLICLLHSEDLAIQTKVKNHCLDLLNDPMLQSYHTVLVQLKTIAGNHFDRVLNFGRIPERNVFLGRISTPEEDAYLKAIK